MLIVHEIPLVEVPGEDQTLVFHRTLADGATLDPPLEPGQALHVRMAEWRPLAGALDPFPKLHELLHRVPL